MTPKEIVLEIQEALKGDAIAYFNHREIKRFYWDNIRSGIIDVTFRNFDGFSYRRGLARLSDIELRGGTDQSAIRYYGRPEHQAKLGIIKRGMVALKKDWKENSNVNAIKLLQQLDRITDYILDYEEYKD